MKASDLFLQNNLKKFGLNPTDWRLKKIQHATYQIANIKDDNFVFVGKVNTKAKMPVWNQLVLASF